MASCLLLQVATVQQSHYKLFSTTVFKPSLACVGIPRQVWTLCRDYEVCGSLKSAGTGDKVFEQQKVFSDLKRNIENLEKNGVTTLRSLVNLGSEVYMKADVPDTRYVFVDIGLGFHVEFTWAEAIEFISVKEERLARQIEDYTRLIASIKAQIKLVCEGIREILQLPA